MKKKEPGSLTGIGIGIIIALALLMIIHRFLLYHEEPFHMRIFAGLFGCVLVLVGTGLIFLAFFFVFYAAKRIADAIFVPDEVEHGDEIIEYLFAKHIAPLCVICFAVSYVYFFFFYK